MMKLKKVILLGKRGKRAMQVIVMEKTSIFISNIELEEQGLEKD